jgi:nucleoside-diphosphate-sugar epimerase
VLSEAKRAELAAAGIAAALFATAEVPPGTTHVLSSVPPDDEGDPVLRRFAGKIQSVRKHFPSSPRKRGSTGPMDARLRGHDNEGVEWVGYLSTTGVYGDTGGATVDETAPLRPTGERGRRRVAAEAAWLSSGLAVHVFRLAGIYGPGRNALEQVRAGTARRVHRPGHVFSRIHVEDIATVLEASMAQPNPGAIYNVCDDEPAEPAEVVAEAARLLGRDEPPLVPFADAELSPMARSFWDDNRRVSNERIKRELGVRLAYPTYRDGLAALL